MQSSPPSRRWFQVSLAEWLILTTLLGIAWWQCARWPVADTATTIVQEPFPGQSPPVTASGWRLAYVKQVKKTIDIKRAPPRRETAVRAGIASAAIVGVWLVGSIAVRAILQRRAVTHS